MLCLLPPLLALGDLFFACETPMRNPGKKRQKDLLHAFFRLPEAIKIRLKKFFKRSAEELPFNVAENEVFFLFAAE